MPFATLATRIPGLQPIHCSPTPSPPVLITLPMHGDASAQLTASWIAVTNSPLDPANVVCNTHPTTGASLLKPNMSSINADQFPEDHTTPADLTAPVMAAMSSPTKSICNAHGKIGASPHPNIGANAHPALEPSFPSGDAIQASAGGEPGDQSQAGASAHYNRHAHDASLAQQVLHCLGLMSAAAEAVASARAQTGTSIPACSCRSQASVQPPRASSIGMSPAGSDTRHQDNTDPPNSPAVSIEVGLENAHELLMVAQNLLMPTAMQASDWIASNPSLGLHMPAAVHPLEDRPGGMHNPALRQVGCLDLMYGLNWNPTFD